MSRVDTEKKKTDRPVNVASCKHCALRFFGFTAAGHPAAWGLFRAMLDMTMAGKLFADAFVPASLIAHRMTFAADIRAQDRGQRGGGSAVNMEATR
jgi:hypothetical protein